VKYIGISECTAKDLRRAHAIHLISAIQMEVSPFTLEVFDPKLAILETARELGVTIVAYSPLGRGLLTGQFVSAPIISSSGLESNLDNVKYNRNPSMTLIPWISGERSPSKHSIYSFFINL
jgi:aryl-alcohol dehydrogenase-like predicted oxidoreductase